MTTRTGPFWDGIEGRAPMPPAAATLGFELIEVDPDEGTIDLGFRATEAFTNPVGNVLGAYLAAMLYDTVGPALLATLGPDRFQSTLQINVQFLRPLRPGRVTAHGRVVGVYGDTAALAATLHDSDGEMVSTATAIATIIPLDHARDAV
jgi:uncharacterized protein (TIGR00369 family)